MVNLQLLQPLKNSFGTIKIEAIYLDIPEGHDHMICLPSEAFMKMRNLQLFINKNAQFSAAPNYLSNELRVLVWPQYPSSSLPSDFHGNNLVEFKMRDSHIKELGGLKLKNLTVMDLIRCKCLTKIPDVSSIPNLEKLGIVACDNLVELHHSVGFLDKLESLSVIGCSKFRILPKRFKLRSLHVLLLTYCSSLEDFPEIECEMKFLYELDLRGTSIRELPSSIENFKELQTLYLEVTSIIELPSSIGNLAWLNELYVEGFIDQLGSVRIVKVDGYSQPINIGMVEEDGIQSTSFAESTSKYEIASTTPTNSSIWESLQDLTLKFCRLSESNFFTYANYFPALTRLDLSGSDIVNFPAQGVRFPWLRYLNLNECKKLEEIFPLPSSIISVEAHECTSLESFALLSEILNKNNGTNFHELRMIDLYGCHKLLAIPSWEEGLQNLAYRSNFNITFPEKRTPCWFSYRKEAHDNNLCEIDINRPHHWNGIDEILVIYVVFGFGFGSVGIIQPTKIEKVSIRVKFLDGSDWRLLDYLDTEFYWTDSSNHVWMHGMIYSKQVDVSRFRFECRSEHVVFKRVGIHFVKNHEENVRDDIGDHIEPSYPFSYSINDEEGDRCLDLMDEKRPHSSTMGIIITELENEDEYPKEDMDLELKLGYPFSYPFLELENDDENSSEDLELEKDDENLKEIFGKRHRDDEYDCNMEPNRCPQQKRPHIYSSTMGTITEVENDLNLDLELKLGLV
ncbi:disease resistance protein RPV1-like [Carya illinoinensis]|uniref:disease resistance protein RPV1-like n=1 Tax=Carya illinoinensis TaxID=32201 RepID=UPI001C71F7F6|nr:disease resistance protein RPV1-like [Carya illinoinensis]